MQMRNGSIRRKSQIELWMLTKIAMLFFILSLAYIAFNISSAEKSALCASQSSATARVITSNINQVISSSAEDMRLVYRFEPSLPVSREKFGERYEVRIAQRELTDNRVQLSVTISPFTDTSCQTRANLFFDSSKTRVKFISAGGEVTPEEISGEKIVTLHPSLPEVRERSKFLVIVKCTEKRFEGTSTIYIDDCKNDNPNECSPLEEASGRPASYLEECQEVTP